MKKGVLMHIKKVIRLNEVDSTNDYLKQHVQELDDGDLVVANKQTKGRGRHGNMWQSNLGNLYFSFIIKPAKRQDIFAVLMRTSVATVKLLRQAEIKAKIKYPNDIVVKKQKIAGILIESAGFDSLDYLIVGVGINVNQIQFPNLENKATSMRSITHEQFDLQNLLQVWIDHFNELKHPQKVYDLYLSQSIIIGETISYRHQDWIVKSVAPDGRIHLVCQNEHCTVHSESLSWSEYYAS
jgi:biotin-[acetyl-CoA-carboxylase] ligase BirA-like protein